MSVLENILYNLVKALSIYDDNEETFCGVSTDFIRKLRDLFFITISEKESTNIPLSKMYCLRKSATLTCLQIPIHIELDDYPPYSDNNQSFLRDTLTSTWDVFMDVPIVLHIMI